jgi:hypothetical protein
LIEEVKDIRLELHEYKNFINAKGLEAELSEIFDTDNSEPIQKLQKQESFEVVNRYPDWDF